MDFHDTLAEQVFDQMKDRAGVTLQQAADRGKLPVDVNLGPADRKFIAVGVAKTADRQPFFAAGDAKTSGELGIDHDHLDRVDRKPDASGEGDEVVDRHHLVDEGVGRDERLWRLAQVLSFLYPKASDEKRWIDGVLARKKGLGF